MSKYHTVPVIHVVYRQVRAAVLPHLHLLHPHPHLHLLHLADVGLYINADAQQIL
jgi:hypothetical protein